MREGIHPEYQQATVTCNCGNTFTVGSTKKKSMWKSAPNAIRSIRVSRNPHRPADVLKSSTKNTACNYFAKTQRIGSCPGPFLFVSEVIVFSDTTGEPEGPVNRLPLLYDGISMV